jgi:hypothetical protein
MLHLGIAMPQIADPPAGTAVVFRACSAAEGRPGWLNFNGRNLQMTQTRWQWTAVLCSVFDLDPQICHDLFMAIDVLTPMHHKTIVVNSVAFDARTIRLAWPLSPP